MLRPLLAAVFIAACATPVAAADGPAGMPAFKPQTLVLTDIPKATGKAVSLFNGKDLNDWDAWLGYADPEQTYRPDHGPSLGVGGKGEIFDVPVSGLDQQGLVNARLSGPELLSGGSFGLEASVIALTIATAAGIGLVILAVRRGQLVAPWWVRRKELPADQG